MKTISLIVGTAGDSNFLTLDFHRKGVILLFVDCLWRHQRVQGLIRGSCFVN